MTDSMQAAAVAASRILFISSAPFFSTIADSLSRYNQLNPEG